MSSGVITWYSCSSLQIKIPNSVLPIGIAFIFHKFNSKKYIPDKKLSRTAKDWEHTATTAIKDAEFRKYDFLTSDFLSFFIFSCYLIRQKKLHPYTTTKTQRQTRRTLHTRWSHQNEQAS